MIRVLLATAEYLSFLACSKIDHLKEGALGTLKLWSGQDALTELPRKGAEVTSFKEEGASRKSGPQGRGSCKESNAKEFKEAARASVRMTRFGKAYARTSCKDELQGNLLNGFQSWMTIKTGRLETILGKFKPRKRLAGKQYPGWIHRRFFR